ncbi:MAG TPA: DUF4115 domain-containing protein, partial [Companilactobacillus farciminis]|nr:DUF4115 domain-containing protein [Companilactobacillus farciminis]
KKTTKKKAAKKTETKSKETAVKESDTEGTYTITNAPSDGLKVVVEGSNGQAWIQFKEGDNTTWQQALSADEKKETTVPSDTTTFTIQTGNVNNTKVTIDGKDVDLSKSQSGDTIVKTLTFNIEK